ncbi:MAG: PEP-CTERM sorting domain-containing protein [Steroidobacteraceae bacterium]
MKTLNKTLICTALVGASALALAPLANATPELEVAIGSSGCSTVKATSNTGVVGWTGTDSTVHFTAITLNAFGLPVSGPPDYLNSDTLDVHSSGSGTLYLCVTETGLSGPISTRALSSFASAELPRGWTVSETTYADAANAAFGTADTLGTHAFATTGLATSVTPLSIAGTFSLTEIYQITAVGGGTTSDSIDIAETPEPATLALLAVGLLGTAIGLRRRRRN